jgi:hypothetical protein
MFSAQQVFAMGPTVLSLQILRVLFEGKGREGKGREGKGREGKGREETCMDVVGLVEWRGEFSLPWQARRPVRGFVLFISRNRGICLFCVFRSLSSRTADLPLTFPRDIRVGATLRWRMRSTLPAIGQASKDSVLMR